MPSTSGVVVSRMMFDAAPNCAAVMVPGLIAQCHRSVPSSRIILPKTIFTPLGLPSLEAESTAGGRFELTVN